MILEVQEEDWDVLVVATAPASGLGKGCVVRGILLSTPEWEFEEQALITPDEPLQDACLQQLQACSCGAGRCVDVRAAGSRSAEQHGDGYHPRALLQSRL